MLKSDCWSSLTKVSPSMLMEKPFFQMLGPKTSRSSDSCLWLTNSTNTLGTPFVFAFRLTTTSVLPFLLLLPSPFPWIIAKVSQQVSLDILLRPCCLKTIEKPDCLFENVSHFMLLLCSDIVIGLTFTSSKNIVLYNGLNNPYFT